MNTVSPVIGSVCGSPAFPIPHTALSRLRRSIDDHGFGSLSQGIQPQALVLLQSEAEQSVASAQYAEQQEPFSYKASVASLGSHAKTWLCKAAEELLPAVFGEHYQLTLDRSCLTFYGTGCHLGAHVDQPATTCEVTIILYLSVTNIPCSPAQTGLVLNVFSGDPSESGQCVLRIPTQVGTLVLGRGSQVWHERPELLPGESVVAITGCFQRRSQ